MKIVMDQFCRAIGWCLIGMAFGVLLGCARVEPVSRRTVRTDECPPGKVIQWVAVPGVDRYLTRCVLRSEVPPPPKWIPE